MKKRKLHDYFKNFKKEKRKKESTTVCLGKNLKIILSPLKTISLYQHAEGELWYGLLNAATFPGRENTTYVKVTCQIYVSQNANINGERHNSFEYSY